jgi:hypothetical protein
MNGIKSPFCEKFKKKYYEGIDEYRKEYLGNNYEYLNFKRKTNKLISDYFKPNKKIKKSFEGVVDKINKKIINNNINHNKNDSEIKLNINLKEENNISSNTSTGVSLKNNFNEFYKKISQTMEELKKDDEVSSSENNNFFDLPLFDSNSQSKKDENINTLNLSFNNNNTSNNSINKHLNFKNFPLNTNNSYSNTYNINSNLFSKNCSFDDSNLGINSRLSCNTISSKITTQKKKVKKSNILTEKIRNKITQNNNMLFKKDDKKSKRGNNNFDEDIKKFIQKKFYGCRKLSIDSNKSQNNEINNNDDNQVLAYKTPEKILKHSLINNKMSNFITSRNLYGLLNQSSNKLIF